MTEPADLPAGDLVETSGNRPVLLNEEGVCWLVTEGAADVFFHERPVGAAVGRHVLRAAPGRLLFGTDDPETALVARGLPGTRLRRIRADALASAAPERLAAQTDLWVSEVAEAVAGAIEPRPGSTLLLAPQPGDAPDVTAGSVLSARAGAVVWVEATTGALAYLGTEELEAANPPPVPVTAASWVTVSAAGWLRLSESADLLAGGGLLAALGSFHRLVLSAERLNRRLLLADAVNEQRVQRRGRLRDQERRRRALFGVLERHGSRGELGQAPLLGALALVGGHEGIAFRAPPARGDGAAAELPAVLDASGVRARRVRLSFEDRWWLGDSGAMLGFLAEGADPVALLPGAAGRYRMVDPATGRSSRLDARRAGLLAPDAWLFYRPLRADEPAGFRQLLRLARRGGAGDLARVLVWGAMAAVGLQAPAVALGLLSGGTDGLWRIVAALGAFSALAVVVQMLQGTALMRLEGRATARLEAATWDRLLRLPSAFLRRFSAGELVSRLGVFAAVRDRIAGAVAQTVLSIVFLAPTLGILFAYDVALALVAGAIGLAAVTVTAAIGFRQMAPERQRFEAQRRLAGGLLQIVNGMRKIRTAGAEPSALAAWAGDYHRRILAEIRIARLGEHMAAVAAAVPALAMAALFATAAALGPTPADFLVVLAVSGTFYLAVTSLGRSFQGVATIGPGYEQVKPVLAALPESRAVGESLALSGAIRFDSIRFRYGHDAAWVLEDVSFEARPGEFVAIVGTSGSGKSTLVRLAVGLERPTAGAVYFDGRDMALLDAALLRRQMGVVLQEGALVPGTILENIVGIGEGFGIDDAWRVVDLVGLRAEIAAMPMGLYTHVNEGMSLLSGGQIQRIRIAASLLGNPRIVLLDEATSWLDSQSQDRIMEAIEGLTATRLVVAHRLSTIASADRILVLADGRIAQQGAFEELAARDGPFRDLVSRQLA